LKPRSIVAATNNAMKQTIMGTAKTNIKNSDLQGIASYYDNANDAEFEGTK